MLIINHKFRLVRSKFLLGVLFLIAILMAMLALRLSNVHAAEPFSWISGSFNLGEDQPHVDDQSCRVRSVAVIGVSALPETASACVYERPHWRYALYQKCINLGYMTSCGYYFVVGIGSDSSLYVVSNMSGDRRPVEVPGSNDLLFNTLSMGFTNNHRLTVIKDFPSHLQRSFTGPLGTTQYQLKDSAEQPLIPNEQGEAITTGAVGVSPNGNWLAVEAMGTGLMLMNTKTSELRWFSNFTVHYGVGSDAHIQFVISNDGRSVATFDYNIEPRIYSLSDGCTIRAASYNDAFVAATRSHSSCPNDGGRMQTALATRFSAAEIRSISASKFSDEGDVLYFLRYEYGNDPAAMDGFKIFDVPLYSSGYVPPPPLDYLALGDSYSSGEGDIEKNSSGTSYYSPVTDYAGGCHISSRSYPFLLRSYFNVTTSRMQSVACSGAKADDMIKHDQYLGQGDRLKDQQPEERNIAKETALNKFIPGKMEQVRFVEKYKPKAITLTAGGNDVDFAGKIVKCATSGYTCEYASSDKGKAQLGYELKNEFTELRSLYKSLHDASPTTKIYTVGYPSFINPETWRWCGYDDGHLDGAEKIMIDESLKYLNQVIKTATEAAGGVYLDIENSLDGGRVCDAGGEYVTSLWDVGVFNKSQYYTTFHPNAVGHQKIANSIENQLGENTLLNYSYTQVEDNFVPAPALSSYFANATNHYDDNGTKHKMLVNGSVTKLQPAPINLDAYTFEPGSSVMISAYSEPTQLGTLTAIQDGGLSGTFIIPDSVPAGYHTLVLSGKTYSGEILNLYQTILVTGNDPSDEDEDGIPDSRDKCMFMQQSASQGDSLDAYCKIPLDITDSSHGDRSSKPKSIESKISNKPSIKRQDLNDSYSKDSEDPAATQKNNHDSGRHDTIAVKKAIAVPSSDDNLSLSLLLAGGTITFMVIFIYLKRRG